MNCRACGRLLGEHPVCEMDSGGTLRCEYFVDPETNGIGSAALKLSDDWPGWPPWAGYIRTEPVKFLPFPATIPKSGNYLPVSNGLIQLPEEPRTAPAKYEPYALAHAEVLTKRRAEITRVQPAFEKAWKAWQDPSPRNLWWRKYYHIFW